MKEAAPGVAHGQASGAGEREAPHPLCPLNPHHARGGEESGEESVRGEGWRYWDEHDRTRGRGGSDLVQHSRLCECECAYVCGISIKSWTVAHAVACPSTGVIPLI